MRHHATGIAIRRDVTVEAIMRDLLANPPSTWRAPSTFQVNRDLAEGITGKLGKTRLVNLTPSAVERYLGEMAREGLATSTIGSAKGLLVRAIRRAQRDGLVGRNVAELADTPVGTRTDSKSMTVDQLSCLFASDLTVWWRAFLMVGIGCGLRPGELLALTWDDLDFDAGEIRVRNSLKAEEVTGQATKTVMTRGDLKTPRARRTLPLPAKAAEALRAQKASQAADKLRRGRYYEDAGLVFSNNAGRPKRGSTVNKRFKVICDQAGIDSDWHLHEQRHTFVSLLSDAGIDIDKIADAAGHINANVTRTVYRHQLADKISEAGVAMNDIFGRVTGS